MFLKDETELAESRERLARAQSIDADASARLQAAVLLNGEHVDSAVLEYGCSAMPSKLVDGDFMDVMRLAPDSVDVLLGDVMGKGMDAAIMGAVIKVGLFRSLAVMSRGEGGAPSVRDICAATERGMFLWYSPTGFQNVQAMQARISVKNASCAWCDPARRYPPGSLPIR